MTVSNAMCWSSAIIAEPAGNQKGHTLRTSRPISQRQVASLVGWLGTPPCLTFCCQDIYEVNDKEEAKNRAAQRPACTRNGNGKSGVGPG